MTAATHRSELAQANVLSKMWWAVMLRAIAVTAFAFLAYFWMGRSLPNLACAVGLISRRRDSASTR